MGILISKDEEDDNRNGDVAHWVVSVDGSSEEEVVSEKMLGRVLETQDQSDSSTFEKSLKEKPAKNSAKPKFKAGIKRKTMKAKSGVNTRAGSSKNGEVLRAEDIGEIERRSAPRPKKRNGDETVIEVKMLTGTLFIYRGENHRVEFVRTA